MNSKLQIGIIGAGVVGLSCALWLQRKGFAVSLIDPADPGSGTSSGNSGAIAEYGCVPVNSPDLFKRLPALLFARSSPLSVDLGYVLSHPVWMTNFLLNCRRRPVSRITRLLGQLLSKTYAGLDPLLEMASARDLLQQQGCIYAYRSEAEFANAKADNLQRRAHGAEYVELDRAGLRDLEPNLKIDFERGLLFERASHILDPEQLCQRYFNCFKRHQGSYHRQRARAVEQGDTTVTVRLDNGESQRYDRLVIAAGAFSKSIEGIPMQLLPLDTERGYHLQFNDMQHLLTRPVCWNQAGFYATPMQQGMRIAGTVEIAGYNPRKNPRHLDYLQRRAQEMLDLPAQADRQWLGFRPTLPDALPVIGYSTASEYIMFAFGHHHLGLTLAGITGKLIAELANGEDPSHNIAPFSPRRFF